MSVANKVKYVIGEKNKKRADLASELGISGQAVSNKFVRDSFSTNDLIKIANFLGVTLAFVDGNKVAITFETTEAKCGNKIKYMLGDKGKNRSELATAFGISRQAINSKFIRDSFSAYDLIKIAEFLGVTLALVDGDKIAIAFDASDISER